MMTRTAALAVAALAVACTRPGQERAERDLEVGQASNAELAVNVEGGLAVIESLGRERVALWASAPDLVLELDARDAGPLLLEARNVMAGCELESLDTPGTLLPIAERARPTHAVFELSLQSGRSRFRLRPTGALERGAFRFALLSDVQEAIDRIQDIFGRLNGETGVHFLLGAGDLTERGSVAELRRYQRELERLSLPYYTTLGNHELGTTPPPYHSLFGRGSFQFRYRGVAFTLLDSASATLDPLVYDWLDGWLEAARSDVHVVAMHIPPLDPAGVRNGAFGSRAEASALVAELARARVDLALYGHIHSYYHYQNAGIESYVSGGGGAIPERFDDIGRHYLLIDVDPERGVSGVRVGRVDGE